MLSCSLVEPNDTQQHSTTCNERAHPVHIKFTFIPGETKNCSPFEELVIFGSGDTQLYALDLKTGRTAWQFQTLGEIFSSPSVADGMVYVGSNDGNFYAVNARTMDINVKGAFLGSKQAIPLMRAGGGGSSINISSGAGIAPQPGTSGGYSASPRPFSTPQRTSAAIPCTPALSRPTCSVRPGPTRIIFRR